MIKWFQFILFGLLKSCVPLKYTCGPSLENRGYKYMLFNFPLVPVLENTLNICEYKTVPSKYKYKPVSMFEYEDKHSFASLLIGSFRVVYLTKNVSQKSLFMILVKIGQFYTD